MSKINNDLKNMFGKHLAVIATASKGGIPNVGPKGSMHVLDDETLVYSEATGEKTLKNLQQNPKTAVVIVDRDKGDGYQIKGTAEILTSGDIFEISADRSEKSGRPRPKHVVRIKVEEVYSVKSGMTAKKLD
jgi:predicted pyridoxine 5'-phosphate oxidase superfamily flavin-nucleotide-binding protein